MKTMAEISNEESAEMGTILVVEDDTGLLLLIGKNLGRLGYATALFSNEEKAMERILFNPPQLLMLDYQLATMTGREFLETLSTKCTLPPFIIMTGHGNETIAVKMMKLGAIDYLIKDHVFLDLLPSVVEQAMDNIKTQQKLVVAEREKAALQEQLKQSQKMEAIGTLAGGIAHDYNNLLSVILGNIELAEEDAATGSSEAKSLSEAKKATMRAAALTNKFITFSSGGSPVKQAIRPQEFFKDTASIALSGSNIQCDFSIDQDLRMFKIDIGQMSQAIGNIITNSREAMPQGGCIRLMVHNLSAEQMAQETGLTLPGELFVKISIADQGKGIPKEILANIFDPYFSTKERGEQKGMGLGLTIADSIIKKHGGHIQVESEEGKGTTVSIYLPVLQRNEAEVCQDADTIVDAPTPTREKKTTKILVMDDEKMIRDMAHAMLKSFGYEQVEVAPHGEEVLKMYAQAQEQGKPFDLLIRDLTIKGGMGGEETMKRFFAMNQKVSAIVCSGYANDPILANYAAYGFSGVLAKPFSSKELNNAITKVLDKK